LGTFIPDLGTPVTDLGTLILDLKTLVPDLGTLVPNLEIHAFSLQTTIYALKITVSGLKIYISDLEILISDLEILISDLEITISDLEILISDLEITISDLEIYISDWGAPVPALRILMPDSRSQTAARFENGVLLRKTPCLFSASFIPLKGSQHRVAVLRMEFATQTPWLSCAKLRACIQHPSLPRRGMSNCRVAAIAWGVLRFAQNSILKPLRGLSPPPVHFTPPPRTSTAGGPWQLAEFGN
jgi:hypothetical protein